MSTVRPPGRKRLGLVLASASAVVAVAGILTVSRGESVPGFAQIIADEAAFVASAQLTVANGCPTGSAAVGAIVANPPAPPGRYAYADPYQANYGAFAMLIAGRAYYDDVFGYIRWYLRHVSYSTQADTYQGVVGSIFDYTVDLRACSEARADSYDSSDAYAGTFLSLVSAFARADPSQAAYFASPGPRRDLAAIASAIQTTQGKNGLTSALASLMPAGQYTEDNIESSQGLADYVGLLASEGDANASYWAGIASSIRNGIASHEWLPGVGAYRNAADQSTAGFTPCGAGQVQLWPAWDLQGTSRWRRSVISRYPPPIGAGRKPRPATRTLPATTGMILNRSRLTPPRRRAGPPPRRRG